MALQVFTAVTGAAWESELVGALDRADHGVTVVRRCVDVSELLAAAATGTGQAALLSAELRRLDGDAIARLDAAGVAVVGLVEPGDDRAAERLRQLGVRRVLPADAEPEAIAQALREAVAARRAPGRDVADPRAALPALGLPDDARGPAGRGRAGSSRSGDPTGAPGRTTVAVGLADEAARLGVSDAAGRRRRLRRRDRAGAGPARRVARAWRARPGWPAPGRLDAAALVRLAWAVRPHLRVLTGLARADRWPELRPRAVDGGARGGAAAGRAAPSSTARSASRTTRSSPSTPRRPGATVPRWPCSRPPTRCCASAARTRWRCSAASGRSTSCGTCCPTWSRSLVVNQVRRGPVPGDPRQEIAAALERFAGREVRFFLPADRRATDAALAAGRTLAEVAPGSPLRVGAAVARRRGGRACPEPAGRRAALRRIRGAG